MENELIILSSDGSGNTKESILSKMESKGLNPNNSCRSGYCGDCAMKLKKGEIIYFSDPMGFCREDEILTCISHIKGSDVVLA